MPLFATRFIGQGNRRISCGILGVNTSMELTIDARQQKEYGKGTSESSHKMSGENKEEKPKMKPGSPLFNTPTPLASALHCPPLLLLEQTRGGRQEQIPKHSPQSKLCTNSSEEGELVWWWSCLSWHRSLPTSPSLHLHRLIAPGGEPMESSPRWSPWPPQPGELCPFSAHAKTRASGLSFPFLLILLRDGAWLLDFGNGCYLGSSFLWVLLDP